MAHFTLNWHHIEEALLYFGANKKYFNISNPIKKNNERDNGIKCSSSTTHQLFLSEYLLGNWLNALIYIFKKSKILREQDILNESFIDTNIQILRSLLILSSDKIVEVC